jgi:hypothetical protein
MIHIMVTAGDLRNWVDSATDNWIDRTDADIDAIVDGIRNRDDCPAWGRDWSEYLNGLPDLTYFCEG